MLSYRQFDVLVAHSSIQNYLLCFDPSNDPGGVAANPLLSFAPCHLPTELAGASGYYLAVA